MRANPLSLILSAVRTQPNRRPAHVPARKGTPTMRQFSFVSLSLALLASFALAQGNPGPDVIVGDLHETLTWGQANNMTAFSVGTVSCNIGTSNLAWISTTN